MRKRRILGISLVVLAFVFLFGFIVFPVIPQLANAPVFDSVLGVILCQPNQTLVRDQYSQTFGAEQNFSMEVYCKDASGERTDVTNRWGQIGVVGYLALFLPGMYITTGTRQKNRQEKAKSKSVPYHAGAPEFENEVVTYGGVELGGNNLTPEQIETFKRRVRAQSSMEDSPAKSATNGGGTDLTDKLRQAQEAHESGLINDDEYNSLRQQILDDMK